MGKSKRGAYCNSCGLAGIRMAADTPSCARLFSDSVLRLGVLTRCFLAVLSAPLRCACRCVYLDIQEPVQSRKLTLTLRGTEKCESATHG